MFQIKLERTVLGLVLGAIAPISGFLVFWWGSFALVADRFIPVLALSGLIAGLIIDFFFLKKWITRAYNYNLRIWSSIYIFYSVGLFGFFMGVPVFNIFLAIPAGLFIGRRSVHQHVSLDQRNRIIQRARLFTTFVLGFICMVSAIIALIDPYTGSNLRGMFNLNFEITPAMIRWVIVSGGLALMGINWWLTTKTINLARKW